MEYNPAMLESKILDTSTKYIVVYPDPEIDLIGFVDDLRALLNDYHAQGQAWTIGSNIVIDNVPLVDAGAEIYENDNQIAQNYNKITHPGV